MYSSNWIVEDLGVGFAETRVGDDIFFVTLTEQTKVY